MRLVRRVSLALALTAVAGLFAGCGTPASQDGPLPTTIVDLNAAATAMVMTQNAPPGPFNESIAFESLEDGLRELDGWTYTAVAEFEGTFTGTSRPANATTTATVAYHLLTSARRVEISAEGSLLAEGDPVLTEAVRIGRDVYLTVEGQCSVVTGTDAAVVADAGVTQLIGGLSRAVPVGQTGVINGESVYRYTFDADALELAAVTGEAAVVSIASAELWFSAEHGVVIRLYLVLDVDNAVLFGSSAPVSGRLVIRYDLTDVGVDPNITVPFGC